MTKNYQIIKTNFQHNIVSTLTTVLKFDPSPKIPYCCRIHYSSFEQLELFVKDGRICFDLEKFIYLRLEEIRCFVAAPPI